MLCLIATSAIAETWIGSARVVDGDTLHVQRSRLRLLSMDAFETKQSCTRNGKEYACGQAATQAMTRLIGQRDVHCQGNKRDRYRRPLVNCRVGKTDLGRQMVRLGWAVAEYGREYRADQAFAKAAGAGAWAGTFQRPRDWRRTHPRPRAP